MYTFFIFVAFAAITTSFVCEVGASTKIIDVDNFFDVEPEDSFTNCVCVPFWQCKDDFSGLEEDDLDAGMVDVRRVKRANKKSSSPSQVCTGELDVCCKVRCGQTGKSQDNFLRSRMFYSIFEDSSSRILGETSVQADFAEYPWMLGILKGRVFKCGGSLIHPKVAITAAHCVSTKGLYTVRAGEWNWEEKTEPLPHQDRFVEKIIIHPQFSQGSLRNDLAMLILKSPFKLTQNVGVVCLPTPETDLDLEKCVATGWGKNSFRKGTYQPILKKIELPLVDRTTCTEILRNVKLGPRFQLHQSFICAGGQSNKDTCKGDGGSPLMCPLTDQPDRYEQIGIVSWGLTCGLEQTPGVYVNVVKYSQWIDQKMLSLGFDTDIYRY